MQFCAYRYKSDDTACEDDAGAGGVCLNGSCIVGTSCEDGVTNQDETDEDCGGSICEGCGLGGACLGNADCAAGVCDMVGSNTCETADTCGNGAVETGEACDDGDVLTGDGCDGSCLKEIGQSCTLSTECAGGYVCDAATMGSNTCEAADSCGNGTVEMGEACDDGDVLTGDGCDDSCLRERRPKLHTIDRVRQRICLRLGDNGLKYV